MFEASIVTNPESLHITNASLQFVSDNADHNTRTIDGSNTFHAMGGIMTVTPDTAVKTFNEIDRLKKLPTATEVSESFPFLQLQKVNFNINGFKNIKVKDIKYRDCNYDASDLKPLDLLWLVKKNKSPDSTKGWISFRERHSTSFEYSVSKIIPLKFANNPPSQYDTIFTVLIEASTRARAHKQ